MPFRSLNWPVGLAPQFRSFMVLDAVSKSGRYYSNLSNRRCQKLRSAFRFAEQPRRRLVDLSFTYTSSRCPRQWRNPGIRLTRSRRMSSANSGPNRFHRIRTVLWQTSMPRSNITSSTFRNDSGNRTYITSGDELKRLNGLGCKARDLRCRREI